LGTTSSSEITAVSFVCAESPNTVPVPPFSLNFTNNSLPGKFNCERLTFKVTSRLAFKQTTTKAIALLLIDYHESEIEYVLRNSKKAIYGRIMTDGITINSAKSLNNVTVVYNKPIPGYDDFEDRFPIKDIAVQINGILVPLNIPVTETNESYTFHISNVQNHSAYFVIHRIRDFSQWSSLPRQFFSTGELAYLSIILALYAIGCIGGFIKICISFMGYDEKGFLRVFVILLTIFSFFLFRTVLFSFVLQGAIIDTPSPAVGYVLIEFPIILFFSFVTQYIVLWLVFLNVSHGKMSSLLSNWVQQVNIIVFLVNCFIFIIFIIIIILFETIIKSPQLICQKQLTTYDEEGAFIILMVYRAIFSTISIILGFLLSLSGVRMLVQLSHEMSTYKTITIGAATVFGAFGCIAQGTYYLVITATRGAQSNYLSLSILLIVEIIPALAFLMLTEVSVKKLSQKVKSLTGITTVRTSAGTSQN
jgi:hypothetical protein